MRFGIDIGGSHISVGLVDDSGNIITKKEKDLLKKENIEEEITNIVKQFITEIMEEQNNNNIEMIGIAYPGNLRDGKIGGSVNLGTKGFEIEKILEKYFKIPTYIKNDAKCAAICEKKYGSLKQYANAIFLTIGTGIGGAVFYNHNLLQTPENDMFKVGHITIQKDGPKCKCGRNGCFENYASIRALKRNILEKFQINQGMTGLELHDFIIKNLYNENMQEILNVYIENLAVGISNLINLFEPEAISIGGSFAYYDDIFLQKLKKKLKENQILYNDSYPQVILAVAKNDAGIIGATRIKE